MASNLSQTNFHPAFQNRLSQSRPLFPFLSFRALFALATVSSCKKMRVKKEVGNLYLKQTPDHPPPFMFHHPESLCRFPENPARFARLRFSRVPAARRVPPNATAPDAPCTPPRSLLVPQSPAVRTAPWAAVPRLPRAPADGAPRPTFALRSAELPPWSALRPVAPGSFGRPILISIWRFAVQCNAASSSPASTCSQTPREWIAGLLTGGCSAIHFGGVRLRR